MNTNAVLLKRQADHSREPMTNADLCVVLRQNGIDPDTIPPKALALIFELARTHGMADVAIAAALARIGQ